MRSSVSARIVQAKLTVILSYIIQVVLNICRFECVIHLAVSEGSQRNGIPRDYFSLTTVSAPHLSNRAAMARTGS